MRWRDKHRAQTPSPIQLMDGHNLTATKMKPGSTQARACRGDDYCGEEWPVSSEGSWEFVESGGGGAGLVVDVDRSELVGGCCVDGVCVVD